MVDWSHAAVAWSECGNWVSYLVMECGSRVSCLVVEPGCQETSGRRAWSLELWHCGSCASCPVCWTWLPESRGSHPWRSAVPMALKASRSGPSVMTDWLMWSLNHLSDHWQMLGWSCVFLYPAWWAELRLAVAAVSTNWPVNWGAECDWLSSTV
jgi:hypothetical protein